MWAFVGVYGDQARIDKLRFLEELLQIRDGWLVLRAWFNEILHPLIKWWSSIPS